MATKYGYTDHHDRALDECIANHGGCQFNCAKDGAPNCAWHVAMLDCEPAKLTVVNRPALQPGLFEVQQ